MWPRAEPIRTERLLLEPLAVEHAGEMTRVLADPVLYAFTGGEPPSEQDLARRYALQSVGESPDGTSGWLNWVIRKAATDQAAGYVQATLVDEDGLVADVAWVVGVEHQGRGLAVEAAGGMLDWLSARGATTVRAYIHPDNAASNAVAAKLGLVATDAVVDGEVLWSGQA